MGGRGDRKILNEPEPTLFTLVGGRRRKNVQKRPTGEST